MKKWITAFAILALSTGCQNKSSPKLEVGASSVPHAEILEIAKSEMAKKGIDMEIIVIDDYQLPNRLLDEKQIDANFFQHGPFLEKEMSDFGYQLMPLAKVHIEPLGIYSKNITDLNQLQNNSIVAIPSDPTNEWRALKLLEEAKLITLKSTASQYATILDIQENPLHLKIEEVDAPLLPRLLSDVDAAVIPGNFALQGKLDPRHALLLENKDSPYANILVIRKADAENTDLLTLATVLKGDKVSRFIEEKYEGRILPAN